MQGNDHTFVSLHRYMPGTLKEVLILSLQCGGVAFRQFQGQDKC